MAARTETRRNALLTIAAVLVGVVALNVVASIALPFARIDLTQDRLYSTSRGVDRTLASLDEPVRVDYFWTQEGSKDQPLIRAHGLNFLGLWRSLVGEAQEYLELFQFESLADFEIRWRALGADPRLQKIFATTGPMVEEERFALFDQVLAGGTTPVAHPLAPLAKEQKEQKEQI